MVTNEYAAVRDAFASEARCRGASNSRLFVTL